MWEGVLVVLPMRDAANAQRPISLSAAHLTWHEAGDPFPQIPKLLVEGFFCFFVAVLPFFRREFVPLCYRHQKVSHLPLITFGCSWLAASHPGQCGVSARSWISRWLGGSGEGRWAGTRVSSLGRLHDSSSRAFWLKIAQSAEKKKKTALHGDKTGIVSFLTCPVVWCFELVSEYQV